MFKEGTGLFLERWIDRQALPIIAKTVGKGDVFKLSAGDEKWKKLTESIAINRAIDALNNGDVFPTRDEFMAEIQKEYERLQSRPQIFVKAIQTIMADAVDTKVHVTNEDLDTAVTIQNLINLMPMAPEYRDSMLRQTFDLMGLTVKKNDMTNMPQVPGMPPINGSGGQSPIPPGQPGQQMPSPGSTPPSLQGIIQKARLPQR